MNTILLQKILDILKEGLAHVGDFFKDLFVSDPQDGQVIVYDAETAHWVNKDATEVELNLTNTFEAQAISTFSDGAENVPMKSLVVDIVPQQASGSDEVVITHTGKNLFDIQNATIVNGTIGYTFTYSASSSSYIIPLPKGDYVISLSNPTSTICRCATINEYPTGTDFSIMRNNYNAVNASSAVFNVSNTIDSWLVIQTNKINVEARNSTIQVEKGTTATTYEPYTATTHTVTLSASIENGYIDIISGQGKDTDNDTDITCTPTTIKTKGGTESIFADCGDVSGEYYTKTSESVLALVNITEDITASITKNTTDFSDILLKVSQNNKVVSIEIYSATTSAAVNDTFLSNLPKPAMNSKVLLVNTTLGEDGTILGTLKTSGELAIATSGAKSFSGLITYVAK